MTSSEFQGHQVFQKLELLKNRIQENEPKEKIDVNKIDFFNTGCDFISSRLKHTIPTIIQNPEMDALATELENSLTQLNTFLGNNNEGHLNNSVNHLFAVITRIRNFPFPFRKDDFDFSKSITNFQKAAEEKIKQVETQKENLEKKITEAEGKITEKEKKIQDLTNLITQKETQIQQLNTNFQNEFNNIKTNFSNSIVEKEKQVQQLNTNFQTEFTNIKTTSTKQFEDDRANFKKEFADEKIKTQKDAAELIKELQDRRDEAKKIVNVVGNIGVTGNYQQIANYHKGQANLFRWISISVMVIGVIYLAWTLLEIKTIDWKISLIRVIASAIFIYPAQYASRESAKHRKMENYNRNAELELASIDPFIALLEKGNQQKIKEELVKKYFGNHPDFDKDDGQTDNIPLNAVEKIMKMANDLAKNLK